MPPIRREKRGGADFYTAVETERTWFLTARANGSTAIERLKHELGPCAGRAALIAWAVDGRVIVAPEWLRDIRATASDNVRWMIQEYESRLYNNIRRRQLPGCPINHHLATLMASVLADNIPWVRALLMSCLYDDVAVDKARRAHGLPLTAEMDDVLAGWNRKADPHVPVVVRAQFEQQPIGPHAVGELTPDPLPPAPCGVPIVLPKFEPRYYGKAEIARFVLRPAAPPRPVAPLVFLPVVRPVVSVPVPPVCDAVAAEPDVTFWRDDIGSETAAWMDDLVSFCEKMDVRIVDNLRNKLPGGHHINRRHLHHREQ